MSQLETFSKKAQELAGICDNLEGLLRTSKTSIEATITRGNLRKATVQFNKVMRQWQKWNNGQ